jgi:hypothetical protein
MALESRYEEGKPIMFVTMRKGKAGLLETGAFIAQFPLPADPMGSTVITLAQFDDWGEKAGFLPARVSRDTRNTDRNILRGKINITASSPLWAAEKKEPFHIGVKAHGLSYSIARTSEAFALKANKLPGEIKSLVKTKKGLLDSLHNSMDVGSLPMALQIRISTLNREIERYATRIDYESQELTKEFAVVQREIAKAVATTAILPNPSIQAVLDVDDDIGGDQNSTA